MSYLDFVALDELLDLRLAQQHELLVLDHLREVFLGEQLGGLHQVQAVVSFGKVPDAEAVGGVELTLQEVAARSFHP